MNPLPAGGGRHGPGRDQAEASECQAEHNRLGLGQRQAPEAQSRQQEPAAPRRRALIGEQAGIRKQPRRHGQQAERGLFAGVLNVFPHRIERDEAQQREHAQPRDAVAGEPAQEAVTGERGGAMGQEGGEAQAEVADVTIEQQGRPEEIRVDRTGGMHVHRTPGHGVSPIGHRPGAELRLVGVPHGPGEQPRPAERHQREGGSQYKSERMEQAAREADPERGVRMPVGAEPQEREQQDRAPSHPGDCPETKRSYIEPFQQSVWRQGQVCG